VNPSGKLPISFPASVADLPRPTIPIPNPPDSTNVFNVDYTIEGFNVGYKWFDVNGVQPLFPFGFGLSYTTFSISGLVLTPNAAPASGFQASFNLQNTGSTAGAEVAQVYLRFPADAGEPPKRLVAWKKVPLQAGEKQAVTLTIDANDNSHPLSIWSTASNGWMTPNGDYTVYVGNSSAFGDLAVAGTFRVGP